MKELQIFSEAKAKLSQIQASSSKANGTKFKQRKTLDFLRRIEPFQGLTLTPTAFFLFPKPIPAANMPRRGKGVACSPQGSSVGPSVFVFSSSGLFEQGGEGLAPF